MNISKKFQLNPHLEYVTTVITNSNQQLKRKQGANKSKMACHTIKVIVKKIEITHDGYCTDISDSELYESPLPSYENMKYQIYEPIPIEHLDESGSEIKEDFWYKYVPWQEGEIQGPTRNSYHCGCCKNTGIVYRIIKIIVMSTKEEHISISKEEQVSITSAISCLQ